MLACQANKIFMKTPQVLLYRYSQIQNYPLIPRRSFFFRAGFKIYRYSRLLRVCMYSTALCGGTVIVAKSDPDFRNWCKVYIPMVDNCVRVIFREEENYIPFIKRKYEYFTYRTKVFLYNCIEALKETRITTTPSHVPVRKDRPEDRKGYKPPESAYEVLFRDKALPPSLRPLKELEDKLFKAAVVLINSLRACTNSLKEQAVLMDNLDQLISSNDPSLWDKLGRLKREEEDCSSMTEARTATCIKIINQLEDYLAKDHNIPDEIRQRLKDNIIIIKRDYNKAKDDWMREKDMNIPSRRNWDKVKYCRNLFAGELETLFPNVWLNDQKLNIPLENLDPFVSMVLSNLLFYNKELAEQETLVQAEARSGTDILQNEKDPDTFIKAWVDIEVGREKRKLREELLKSLLAHQAKCEKNVRGALKQQAETYKDLLAEALVLREREVERRMQQLLDEKLMEVRNQQKIEMAKLVGRIQGANEAIAKRGDKEKAQQEKQQFWSACQSLMSAVNCLGSISWPKQPNALRNEIACVSKAAPPGDEFVECVIKSIPAEAVERGIKTERDLKLWFTCKVAKNIRHLAPLVPDETRHKFYLTQIGCAWVVGKIFINDPDEWKYTYQPCDVRALNNYQIADRTRICVEKGDFALAVRYLNLLKGPSAKVAEEWKKEVLLYLECRQAAETLLAYASAMGMT